MSTAPIDYDVLAKRLGGITTTAPTAATPDYDGVAKKLGGVPDASQSDSSSNKPGFFSGLVDAVNPLPAIKRYLWDLPQEAQGDVDAHMVQGDYAGAVKAAFVHGMRLATAPVVDAASAQGAQFKKAYQIATDSSRTDLAGKAAGVAGYVGAGLLPLVGPAAAKAGEDIGNGNVGYGVGEGVGLLGSLVAPEAAGRVLPDNLSVKLPTTLTPQQAAGVDFAMKSGIPLDAATQSGNRLVRGVQEISQSIPGASSVGKRAIDARSQAFADTGRDLASQASPNDLSPEQAAGSVLGGVKSSASKFGSQARQSYSDLAAIDNDPANVQTVQLGTKTVPTGVFDRQGSPLTRTVPVTKDIAVPADLTNFKDALQPLADELTRQVKLGQDRSAPALNAVNEILAGDDVVPASEAEKNLGALKTVLRKNATGPASYLANRAIDQLDTAVQDAYGNVDPAAVSKLMEGRLATANKYDALGIIKQFRDEPVKMYQQLIQPRDQSIGLLRQIQQHAPGELPNVGRTYLEGMMDQANESGGFAHADRLFSNWQALGDETKKLMFPDPNLRGDLSNFFQVAKDAGTVENPSGTAKVVQLTAAGSLLLHNPVGGGAYLLGGKALTHALYNPGVARAMVQGFKVPLSGGAQSAFAAQRILSLVGKDAETVGGSGNANQPAAVTGP